MDCEIEAATGRRETIGERLAALVPAEIELSPEPGGGYTGKPTLARSGQTFRCRRCGKRVELGFGTTRENWAWRTESQYKSVLLCSWTCLRAWETENPVTRKPSVSRGHAPWTPEDDRLICQLYFEDGLTYREIGPRLNPPRSPSSISNRMGHIRKAFLKGEL